MDINIRNSVNTSFISQKKRHAGEVSSNLNSVSFDGRISQATERFADKMIASPKVQKFLTKKGFNSFLKTSLENPGLYEALIALGITCSARPLTVLATPGAKLEDKQYASAQSIASGMVGLASAYLMFDPITKALDDTLVSVNGKNLETAFKNLYKNPEHAGLIEELVKEKIIPDKKTFDEMLSTSKNIYGDMKKFFINNGQKEKISALLVSDDIAKADAWRGLAGRFSKALNSSFQSVKNNGVSETKKYLVHSGIHFQPELKYSIVNSKPAEKMKFILGYSSKFVLFPVLAASTIWAIPKIMKVLFPNHRKFKKKAAENSAPAQVKNFSGNVDNSLKANTTENIIKNSAVFKSLQNPVAANNAQQVSFSGGAGVMKGLGTIYEKGYKNPLSSVLNSVYSKIVYSKSFSKYMDKLFKNDEIVKHGMDVLNRTSAGEIVKKYDTNFFVSNLSDIIAVWGSCLYIMNTIRNKEIEKDRKPALCTNMGLVAVFSFIMSKHIGKITNPIFDALKKTHGRLMNKKLNYDAAAAWKGAQKILVTTFAFRYLGPVLATPAADKVVKLFNNPAQKQANEKK